MFKYAILFASTFISVVHGNQPCLGAPLNRVSFAASPESCDAYIICMNGQTIRGERCPQGLLFEAVSQTCSRSECTNCSPFGIQNLPHPQFCDQYIQCEMSHRTFRTCPIGLLFDRRIGFCNTAHLVECVEDPSITTTSPIPTTTPPSNEWPACFSDGQLHAHPMDCTRFFICVNFRLWEQECPSGFHWNRTLQRCDTPQAAQCSSIGETDVSEV